MRIYGQRLQNGFYQDKREKYVIVYYQIKRIKNCIIYDTI
jgi:hypothetical protein